MSFYNHAALFISKRQQYCTYESTTRKMYTSFLLGGLNGDSVELQVQQVIDQRLYKITKQKECVRLKYVMYDSKVGSRIHFASALNITTPRQPEGPCYLVSGCVL